jgi:cation:H+ antiporter
MKMTNCMIESTAFQLLILVASLAGLASASHFTIKSVEKLIEITGLSDASAGFIILAVLTSTPEIIVAVLSVVQGNTAVSIGDILGSNVFNIGAILGVLGILGYLKLCCTDILVELTDMLSVIVAIPLLLVISQCRILEIPSQVIGVILITSFLVSIFLIAKKRLPPVILNGKGKEVNNRRKVVVISTLLVSFIIVVVSAQFAVNSASNIAVFLGVPQILIGAKLVAIGTSLPEFTIDLAAVRRHRTHLAVGDIIGSCLTNLTLVLGLVLISSPFNVDLTVFIEILPFLVITTIIFWRFVMRGGISKVGGAFLLLTYVLFQVLVI